MNTPRITVGLDHTPAGAAAMRYALALAAARKDPEVVAVHAFELSTRPECRLERDMDEVRRDLRGRCQRWIDDATTGMHPGVRIRLVIADGDPGAVLARAAHWCRHSGCRHVCRRAHAADPGSAPAPVRPCLERPG